MADSDAAAAQWEKGTINVRLSDLNDSQTAAYHKIVNGSDIAFLSHSSNLLGESVRLRQIDQFPNGEKAYSAQSNVCPTLLLKIKDS